MRHWPLTLQPNLQLLRVAPASRARRRAAAAWRWRARRCCRASPSPRRRARAAARWPSPRAGGRWHASGGAAATGGAPGRTSPPAPPSRWPMWASCCGSATRRTRCRARCRRSRPVRPPRGSDAPPAGQGGEWGSLARLSSRGCRPGLVTAPCWARLVQQRSACCPASAPIPAPPARPSARVPVAAATRLGEVCNPLRATRPLADGFYAAVCEDARAPALQLCGWPAGAALGEQPMMFIVPVEGSRPGDHVVGDWQARQAALFPQRRQI